ncbi:RmlC-like cupins domain-containing protein [Dioscorea alata]|uniref:RmlC-like cupins domain-containing protein n=1 Tax=Dioscorea alata TaxID=55571 RepID=A0ACB7VM53_DIOAL|nr:RmlC-like cupins domain-containing protein [Dioscorea alata]
MACSLAYILLFSLLFAPCLASELKREHCYKECAEASDKHERKRCELLCLEREGEGEQEEEEEKSPFLFGEQSFKHWIRSEHGYFKVLERFSKKSPLLMGIENYRIAILQVDPKTFVMPNHWDAHEVFYVINGNGVISMLTGENYDRESQEINEGDVMRVPAGAQVYLINKDDKEKLKIAMLINPISSIPGRFKEFYGVGAQKNFYWSFSTEVLEASFNVCELRHVLGHDQQKQDEDTMVKATDEQIRGIIKQSGNKPFNLLHKRPSISNRHGKLLEVNAHDYQQLRDLNIDISIANITKGSMMMLHYNTEAIKIVLVIRGRGHLEMACPHTERQEHRRESEQEEEEEGEGQGKQEGRGYYQSIKTELTPGKLAVVPAGHPSTSIASKDENLMLLCFGIRVENNQRIFLTGKKQCLD